MAESTPVQLAVERPFSLGALAVEPSSRSLRHEGSVTVVEPRAMQVLVSLARRPGEVVGRQALVDSCWDGRIVGEDAINRAILKLRRALAEAGAGVEVETVQRVGYRLLVPEAPVAATAAAGGAVASQSRRHLLIGGAAVAAAVGTGAGWLAWPRRDADRDMRALELYRRGEAAFDEGARDDNAQAVGFFSEAAALRPDDARIAGALALALRFEQTFRGPALLARSTGIADRATACALALDPHDPDAIAARSMHLPFGKDWLLVERSLRQGLREVPRSGVMNGFLGMLLAAVGRTGEAIAAFERAVDGARFVPLLRGNMIHALFAVGRLGDVDRELAAAAALWPRFADLWWLRFWTFALTGRLEPARAHATASGNVPAGIGPEELAAAQSAVEALEQRSRTTIDPAIARWDALARKNPSLTPSAIGLAAHLGRLEKALGDTDRYLSPFLAKPIGSVPRTTFLFGAPLAPLRNERAFWSIFDQIGLAAYWHSSGSKPDIAV